jgi:cytochrome b561
MKRYTLVAILLHWLIALAIFGNLALGLYMSDLAISPTKLRLYSYHKWAGLSIFAFVVLRILWRVTHRPPALPRHMPSWEKWGATISHATLYGLTLAVPVTGWLFSSAKGFKTVWFGVLPIPDLIGKDLALADILKEWHESLNYLMVALVVLHVAAALKHHLRDRDDVLTRMAPWIRHP